MPGSEIVQSLDRGLAIIEMLSDASDGVTATEVAHHLGVQPTTAFNLLRTLVGRGFVSKSEKTARYRLGEALPRIVNKDRNCRWRTLVGEQMHQVFHALDREVGLVLVEPLSGDACTTLNISPFNQGTVERPLGQTMIPYSSATSLCILAFGSEPQRQNHYHRHPFEDYGQRQWPDEEALNTFLTGAQHIGHVALPTQSCPRAAFPLYDRSGEFIGALGASKPGSASRLTFETMVEALEQAAAILNQHPSPSSPLVAH